MKKDELLDRMCNPQPYDEVTAVFYNGEERRMKYMDLPDAYEWHEGTSIHDEIPVFHAGFKRSID